MSRLTRRQFIAAGLGVGIVAACSPISTPGASPTQPASGTQSPASPKRGGKLRIATALEITELSPRHGTYKAPVFYNLYDTPVVRDLKGAIHPNLARSWESSSDNKVLTLRFQNGVKFHTGRAFSAQDFADHIPWTVKNVSIAAWLNNVERVEIVDATTARMHLKQPIADVLTFMELVAIGDPTQLEGSNTSAPGSGAYRLTDFRQGELVRLSRFDGYWDSQAALLDEIEIRQFPDLSTMAIALERNEADMAVDPRPQDLGRLRQSPNLDFTTVATAANCLMINVTKAPFDNKKVRQGIAWAVDRKRVVDTYYHGFSEPWETPLPEGNLGWASDLKGRLGYDLNRAKQLIAEGGYPNGFESTILVGPDERTPGAPALTEILQADLKKIGVNLRIEQVEGTVVQRRWGTGEFNIVAMRHGRLKGTPDLFNALVWQPDKHPTGFASDEYKRLVAQGLAQFSDSQRQTTYHRLFEIMMDECFTVPVASSPTTFAYRKSVKNVEISGDGYLRAKGIWLES